MTPEEMDAAAKKNVATWPDSYSPERMAELRRLLLPAADRLRARNAQTSTTTSKSA